MIIIYFQISHIQIYYCRHGKHMPVTWSHLLGCQYDFSFYPSYLNLSVSLFLISYFIILFSFPFLQGLHHFHHSFNYFIVFFCFIFIIFIYCFICFIYFFCIFIIIMPEPAILFSIYA